MIKASKAVIDQQLIEHLVWLSRLELSEQEKKHFSRQLDDIVGYISKVQGIAREKRGEKGEQRVELINGLEDNVRQDQARQCLSQQAVLRNAPSRQDGFYRVKAVLDQETGSTKG